MTTLPRESRKALERAVLAARREAEAGARKALDQLAVAQREPWSTLTEAQQTLRRRLRARARQLGDRLEDGGQQGVEHLVSECAYEQWHRMLFATFLAECGLLIEPVSGMSISVDECKELARERGTDWISLASAFAQGMLPQIFRADDAVLEVVLQAEHRQPLEQLLLSLPAEVFRADDSLGWVYQFWQAEAKDAINESGVKIGADQLPAVTQLFTEDYMVEFLLHNTLGAWWAGRQGPIPAETEDEARGKAALAAKNGLEIDWSYLRFVRDEQTKAWTPGSGTFSGWPTQTKSLKFLDPCMGSGRFLVFALPLLARMRMEEEPLSAAQAVHATIRDNLFGLEIDERCAQIGAFNVALTAWKLGGYQPLPSLHVACSGLAPRATEQNWVLLANDDDRLKVGMARLYALFKDAPVLGSLINPVALGGDLLRADFLALQPLLERALAQEAKDATEHEIAVTARGLAKAAEILAGEFTFVATNVPYLGRGKQDEALKDYSERTYPNGKADLATCFVERCIEFCAPFGTAALVTPQNWFFLGTYKELRKQLFNDIEWNLAVKLGPAAFQDMNFWAAKTALCVLTRRTPKQDARIVGFDVSETRDPAVKATLLITSPPRSVSQTAQHANPDARLMLSETDNLPLLERHGAAFQGIATADYSRFGRCFWELPHRTEEWQFQQSTVAATTYFGGREHLFLWEDGHGSLASSDQARIQGLEAVGKYGVAVSQMNQLPVTLFTGEFFDNNCSALVVRERSLLPAVWEYCSSGQFLIDVREIDQAVKVTNASLVKVPFDVAYWQTVATEKHPHGLPKPFSNDPTQWLFNGHPRASLWPLHVALARLLGYQWPRQRGSTFVDCPAVLSDDLEPLVAQDGIVCISSVKGDEAAASRLATLLSVAYGEEWSAATLGALLGQVGSAAESLETWIRDDFFEQHCELFHQRPFIWQIWDGRRDGFNALVNYHKLTRSNLEKLTYAYLGDWIRRQEAALGVGEAASEGRLVAAKQLQDELKMILEGEPPYDLFVRWKPLHQQPVGWEPDLNDGARVNIRPFLMAADVGKKGAGVLRVKPKIKWDKDRGKQAFQPKEEFPWFWGWDGKLEDFAGRSTFDGNRWNDLHYSPEFKMAARGKKGFA